jgi:hypothetical protein
MPDTAGGSYRARFQTEEPRSAIEEIRHEFGKNSNFEIPTRTLLAIAKEVDGAIRYIRAARLDLKGIADDPERREDFRDWQQSQKGG